MELREEGGNRIRETAGVVRRRRGRKGDGFDGVTEKS